MVDVVSTANLHGIYIDMTLGAISTLHKNIDIERISYWHIYPGSGVEVRFLTSTGRNCVLSGIGSYLYHLISADMSVLHRVAFIETISKWCFFINICQCSWPISISY